MSGHSPATQALAIRTGSWLAPEARPDARRLAGLAFGAIALVCSLAPVDSLAARHGRPQKSSHPPPVRQLPYPELELPFQINGGQYAPVAWAEIAGWNWRTEFEGLLAIAESMRNSAPTLANRALPGPMNYPQIPELAQRGLARLQHFFVELNDRLAGRDFVAADRFSIADITAVVAVDFARVVKVRPGEQHPHVQRWRAAMAERPSMSL